MFGLLLGIPLGALIGAGGPLWIRWLVTAACLSSALGITYIWGHKQGEHAGWKLHEDYLSTYRIGVKGESEHGNGRPDSRTTAAALRKPQ